ncbi:MAG: GDSL-type esterase/lipase family protein [Candidatus Sumerlaeaceae bacterium]
MRIFKFLWSLCLGGIMLTPGASNAQVLSGLEVWTDAGTTATISPGKCRVGGRTVTVENPTVLEIPLQPGRKVVDEPYVLEPKLADRWLPGTHLNGCVTANALPGCLEPDSVRISLPDGSEAKLGTDYEVGTEWATIARLPNGRITTDTQVKVSYTVGQMRIDSICVTREGNITLNHGIPANAAPGLPVITTGSLHLANVFLPYHCKAIQTWQVFPIGAPLPKMRPEELAWRASRVPKTLTKLRSGEPLTIVTWGDSVTVGGDSSVPGLAYANLFITRLRERFPKANIRHINAGIGATNTDGRLAAFPKEVLSYQPDLVTIEFVNDMGFGEQKLRSNYDRALSQLRSIGAEVILITPHFVMPVWMGKTYPRGGETRPDVFTLKSIAAEHGIGLADASRRWAHLDAEGVPYVAYLMNGINHPDDRGHALFVEELMTLF